MTFKKMVLSAASATGILLSVSAIAPASLSIVSAAQADTSISVNFGFGEFYDRLQPDGNWVTYEDQYVFVPQHVDHGWRPYTLGHWSYTHRYGWLWVSNERFGWATYHYGRWGYSRDIGWYWVPGHRWAPAWVAWSRGQNEVAWAPLPPHHGDDLDISITIGDVPDYYWQAVPTSAFLSINLSDKIISDRNQVRTIVQQSPPETVRIENNIVINNVIQVNEIEKATNAKVPVLLEKPVTDPNAAGKTDGTTVAIFNPEVKVDTTAKPQKALKVEEIVSTRKAQGIVPEDLKSDQPAAATPALDKNGKPIAPADQPAAKVQVPADAKSNPDAPAVLAPVVKVPEVKTAPATPPVVEAPKDKPVVTPPADTGKATTDAPVDLSKKKKDAGASDQQPKGQNATPPADVKTPPADGKKAQEPAKKDNKGKVKCDPNVETCPPAQSGHRFVDMRRCRFGSGGVSSL